MRTCPACREKSIPFTSLLLRGRTVCPACKTRVEIRPVVLAVVWLYFVVVGYPGTFHTLPFQYRLAVACVVLVAVLTLLAQFAPLESYVPGLARFGLNGRKASPYFWFLFTGILIFGALLILGLRFGNGL